MKRKPGNKKKKKHKRTHNPFFKREKEISHLLAEFRHGYYNMHNPPNVEEYVKMNFIRNEIKRLLDIQSSELYKQNYRRKRFYYEQVDSFKRVYPVWKRRTYYIYLHVRFDVPLHLIPFLSWWRRGL